MLKLLVYTFLFYVSAIALDTQVIISAEPSDSSTDLFILDKEYQCREGPKNDGTLFATVSGDRALQSARSAGITAGKSGYPTRFYNMGGLQLAKPCNKAGHDIYEFPIIRGQETEYPKGEKGVNPGRLRVYYDQYYNMCGIGMKANPDNTGNPHLCK